MTSSTFEARFQRALARLYTDAEAREAAYRGDAAFFKDYELGAVEWERIRSLATSNRNTLEVFAGMLANKRGDKVRELLPLLAATLGKEGWDLSWWHYYCAHYCEVHPEAPADALAFLETVISVAPASTNEDLLEDVVRYERSKLLIGTETAAATPADDAEPKHPTAVQPLLIESFEYDPTELVSRMKAGQPLGEAQPSPVQILFHHHPNIQRVLTVKLSRFLAQLLERCDGSRSLADLAQRAADELQKPIEAVQPAVSRALTQLRGQGVIRFQNPIEGELS